MEDKMDGNGKVVPLEEQGGGVSRPRPEHFAPMTGNPEAGDYADHIKWMEQHGIEMPKDPDDPNTIFHHPV
jgi:hypothetical protein